MAKKRITIYDLADELGFSASYVSKALNNHPLVSEKIREIVKKKANELNYKHNSHAANLRQGSSKTIGVIVPHINQSFFSEAISGIEEVCFENNHSLIICQSHETFKQECKAIDTLIHQNVDCIIISISAETQSPAQLENIQKHNIELVQFDRFIESVDSFKILNDNLQSSYEVVSNLIQQGYQKIALLGGPPHLTIFRERKEGYLKAIKEYGLNIPYHFVVDDVFEKDKAMKAALELLSQKERPDAFFNVSDHQSLGVLKAANLLGLSIPSQLGIFGFANEAFTEIIQPSLSSVNQRSKELGKNAANVYFQKILNAAHFAEQPRTMIVKSELAIRESSMKNQKELAEIGIEIRKQLI